MLTLIRTEEDTTMTAITHDPETNWGFTVGKQSYVGYTTRDAAAEALYDLEKGGACSVEYIVAEPPTMPAEMNKDGDWEMQIGTIDGCPVTGLYNHSDLMLAEMTWRGLEISTDGTYLHLPDGDGDCHGDVSMQLWGVLKDFIREGIDNQLMALAKASDPAPYTPAPCSVVPRDKVQVTRITADDDLPCTRYRIGEISLLTVDDGSEAPCLNVHGCVIDGPATFDFLERLMLDVCRLLTDGRVRSVLGAPPVGEYAQQMKKAA